jgi:hypothetical protein
MLSRLREWFNRSLVHPLEGMTHADWRALRRRPGHEVDPEYWPKAAFQGAVSRSNSITARREAERFGAEIEAARVAPPVVILGHYRSGTTHLHNLLATDRRFAFPTLFQAFNPHTFLTLERHVAPIADRLMLRRRPQDEVALGAGVPNEDEMALMATTCLSPYLGWTFPRSGHDYGRYLTFRDVPAEDVARWKAALLHFLKKLTVRHGDRPLILKSPPHTARIRLILDVLPDARFVHIRRDPYAVFRSTRHLHAVVAPFFRLQCGGPAGGDDDILATYAAMHDAYFTDLPLIPPGHWCEVGYEDLERDPIGEMRSIYERLGLPDFDAGRPALEAYLGTIADYRKNDHASLDEPTRRRVAEAWGRCFAAWGYPT